MWISFQKLEACNALELKRLFDNNFHQWKIIPLDLFRQYLGKNFKFHSNLQVSHSILRKFPKFYKEIFIRWGKHLASPATLPSIGITSIFKLITKAFICIISRIGI